MSAPAQPRQAKLLQLQQARICVTWPSPQVWRYKRQVHGMKFGSENLNGAATLVSEKVHLDEIAVSLERRGQGAAA